MEKRIVQATSAEQNALRFTVQARQILGRQDFIRTGIFCLRLLQSCSNMARRREDHIVVFTNRRDEVIVQQYLEYFRAIRRIKETDPSEASRFFEPELDEAGALTEGDLLEFSKHCVTESSLMTLVPALADYFREHRRFPHIILLDMFMLHGRTVNRIFLALENALMAELRDTMGSRPELKSYAEIRVYAARDETTLLIDRLAKQRSVEHRCSRQMYNDLYMRMIRFRAAVAAGSDGSSLYLRLPHKEIGIRDMAPSSFKAAETYCFKERDTHFIMLSPQPDCVSVASVVTVRTPALPAQNPSESTERFLNASNRSEVFEVLLDDAPEDLSLLMRCGTPKTTNEHTGSASEKLWAVNIIKLVLEYLLLRRVIGAFWEDIDISAVNIESLSRQFRMASALRIGEEDEGRALISALWRWTPPLDTYDHYISIISEGASCIWTAGSSPIRKDGVSDLSALLDIQDEIASVLSRIGYEVERRAYERTVSSVPFTEARLSTWGIEKTYGELISDCGKALQNSNLTASIYDLIAVLARFYEYGAFDVYLDSSDGHYRLRI